MSRREGRVLVPVAVLALLVWGHCRVCAGPDVDHDKIAAEWRTRARDWRQDAERHDKAALESARKAEKALAERDYKAQERYNREARMYSHLARNARNRAATCELVARRQEAAKASKWHEAALLDMEIARLDFEFERENERYFRSMGQGELADSALDRALEHQREFFTAVRVAKMLGLDVDSDIEARPAARRTGSTTTKKPGAAGEKPSADEPIDLDQKVRELKDTAKDAAEARKAIIEMLKEIRAPMPQASEKRGALMRAYIPLGNAPVGVVLGHLLEDLDAIDAEAKQKEKEKEKAKEGAQE